jgi:diadenosine tetraphosphate (Ap4A) HIT family hydrolase
MSCFICDKHAGINQPPGGERVYSLVTIDGVPHFHAHFIPRMSDSTTKGINFITQERSCDEKEVIEVAQKLHAMFN